MTPRPFYRSRVVWFGLPGLVFLSWGWWLSMEHISTVTMGPFGFKMPRRWEIGQSAGDVWAMWGVGSWPDWKFYPYHGEVSVESRRLWRRNLAWMGMGDPTFRYVIIPYYAVVLAYVATWLLTLAWWQRRKSRML